MTDTERPEIGTTTDANGVKTNYLEAGTGPAVVLVHGSGPGVTAYANWRLVMPALAESFHVIAPDMVASASPSGPPTSSTACRPGPTRSSASWTASTCRKRRSSATASAAPSRCAWRPSTPNASTSSG